MSIIEIFKKLTIHRKDETKVPAPVKKETREKRFLDGFKHTVDEDNKSIILTQYIGNEEMIAIGDKINGYSISIGKECFKSSNSLKKISVSYAVNWDLSDRALFNCGNLEEVRILKKRDKENIDSKDSKPITKFYDVKGVLFYFDGKTTILFPDNYAYEEFSVPEGILDIRICLLSKNVKKIIFPQSLRSISDTILRYTCEMVFQSAPELVQDRSETGRELRRIRFQNKEDRMPIHVPAYYSAMIAQAEYWKYPILIRNGDAEEYRPEGVPAQKLITREIDDTDKVEVIGGRYLHGKITIPEKIDGKTVVRIGKNAFKNAEIKEIILPDTIREIGESAFSGCKIEAIRLPGLVSRIEMLAFSETALTEVIIPDNCSLERSVFSNCSKLKSARLPIDILAIPDKLFYKCISLERIDLPDTVGEIGEYAFQGCRKLQLLSLPAGLLRIGNAAFMDSGITELALPIGVQDIPSHLCCGCSSLKRIILSENTKYIGMNAFRDCRILAYISDLNHVKKIGSGAFENCAALKNIVIRSIPELGEKVFSGAGWPEKAEGEFIFLGNRLIRYGGCSEEVTIPDFITIIDSHAFQKKVGLYEIDPWITAPLYQGNMYVKKVVLGPQVTQIGFEAFCGCSNLTTLVLENPETQIMDDAFWGCKVLDKSKKPFIMLHDMLVSYTGLEEDIVIPSDVRRILPCAFDCEKAKTLKTVILGEGIQRLDNREFVNCKIDKLIIPPNVTEISEDAFYVSQTINMDGSSTKCISDIASFICTKDSPAVQIGEEFGVDVIIADAEEVYEIIDETRRNWKSMEGKKFLRSEVVVDYHPILTQLPVEFSTWKAIREFEGYVEMNANPTMLDNLHNMILPKMQEYGVASERWESNWSAVAVTAVFLSQYGYLLNEDMYSIPNNQVMMHAISSRHPVLACYNNMRMNYCHNDIAREAINNSCVIAVTEINKHRFKQVWQSPYNYCHCLYNECSKTEDDKALIAYNRLIGVLRILAEL